MVIQPVKPVWPGRFKTGQVFFSLGLFAVTFVAYLPALNGGFIWDDDSWTTRFGALRLGASGLWKMWTNPTALQQYYPLTGSTFWLDHHLWGLRPFPYHLENILLHATGAVLFWKLLRRLEVPEAWLAAAIFALHPVMVESVAWITERKNVLSLVFYLGSLLTYVKFAGLSETGRRDSQGGRAKSESGDGCGVSSEADAQSKTGNPMDGAGRPKWAAYAAALGLFMASLFAKATAVSLPAVILLLCWWKRGGLRPRRDFLPAAPFLGLAIISSVVARALEVGHVGASGADWAYSFPQRCLVAGRALWFYVGKLLWPANLCFVYPKWQLATGSFGQWLYPLTAASVLLGLWLARKRIGRGPATAVFFYAGTLFPVLGFMDAYGMRYSFVWDHWVYLSSLGLIALASAAFSTVQERLLLKSRTAFVMTRISTIGVLTILGVMTWEQCRMYRDAETVWRVTLARNPRAFLADTYVGLSLLGAGHIDGAIEHFQQALEGKPDFAEAHGALGNALLQQGKLKGALVELQRAVELKLNNAETLNNYGLALFQQGQVADALNQLSKAVSLRPDLASIRFNLGDALLQGGQTEAAVAQFQKAVEIQPAFADAHYHLAVALSRIGRVDEAVSHLQQTVSLRPDFADAHNSLGTLFLQAGRWRDAAAQYETAVTLQPANAFALNNLAWVLATCPDGSIRNGKKAIELGREAERLSKGEDAPVLETLAAAYAEAGRFPEAIQTAKRALESARAQGNKGLANILEQQIQLYQAGKPFRQEGK